MHTFLGIVLRDRLLIPWLFFLYNQDSQSLSFIGFSHAVLQTLPGNVLLISSSKCKTAFYTEYKSIAL